MMDSDPLDSNFRTPEADPSTNDLPVDDDEGEMPWEAAAREAIQRAVSEIAFDEVRGSIYLMSGEDHRFNRVEEEFRDWETLPATGIAQQSVVLPLGVQIN